MSLNVMERQVASPYTIHNLELYEGDDSHYQTGTNVRSNYLNQTNMHPANKKYSIFMLFSLEFI